MDYNMDQKYETINNAVLTNKDRPEIETYAYPLDGRAHIEFSPANLTQNEYSYSLFRKPTKALTNNSLRSFLEIGEGGNSKGQTIGLMENFLGLFNGYSAGECNKTTPQSSVNSKTKFTINEWVLIVSDRNSHCIFLYLNGTLVNNQGVSYKIIPYYRSNVKAIIGCRSDYSQQVIGDIDEILNYNRDLSSPQILNLFKFGNNIIAQNKIHLNKVFMDEVTSKLFYDLKTNNTYCNYPGIRKIYGHALSVNPFQLINQITGPIANSFNILEINKQKIEFPIAMVNDSRCLDSINWNKVFKDDQAPPSVEPVSIFIDSECQQAIAGWKNPTETDLIGYRLFKVHPVNANNELSAEKIALFYYLDNLRFNTKRNGNLLTLSGYDSCRTGGKISSLHSPILLSIIPLHKYKSTKKTRFNSTTNVGCAADSCEGYILDTKAMLLYFNKISQDLTSQEFKIPYLNIEFNKFFCTSISVRSVTSTTNAREIELSDYCKGSILPDLYHVLMENEPNINLEYSIAPKKNSLLQSEDQNLSYWDSEFAISRETNTTNYTYHIFNTTHHITDRRLNPNKCSNTIIDMCNNRTNINRTKNNQTNIWNEYRNWKAQSFEVECMIQKESNSVSEIIGAKQSSFYYLPGFGLPINRINAKTTNAIQIRFAWSQSKTIIGDLIFDTSEIRTNLIPHTLAPNGYNLLFRISNQESKTFESKIFSCRWWAKYLMSIILFAEIKNSAMNI